MSTDTTINYRPTNLVQEDFVKFQKFGLQPYDRAPNDYLRFVAKVFTAWRDPEDKILNYDPFDDFGIGSTALQATSDKSIVAYIDGFKTSYQFTRLTTDADSTDMTRADNIIEETPTTTFIDEKGETVSITKAKYGEYHRFIIEPGICFVDNQLIEITETTEWWFRVPEVRDYTDGKPNFELGQFIVDPLNVYSLLPGMNYKIILSYEYITQFESSTARLQFISEAVAIDEPYLLIGTFTTNEFGMIHQTQPVNESSMNKYEDYIVKDKLNPVSNEVESYFYLRDINPQYLDKKFMANYKNLFKHLQSQLMTVLSESQIANTFHVRVMTEEIDPSVSSGDFVWLDPVEEKWYPAEVSRQIFDKVNGLYLRNHREGTDLLFTSGIIEVDSRYQIIDRENNVLRNLIPGAEYFLQDDLDTVQTTAPFIDIISIEDYRDNPDATKYFRISTTVIAKADKVKVEFMNNPDGILTDFNISNTFEMDYKIGEQRIPQNINWVIPVADYTKVPNIKNSTGTISTDNLQFKFTFDMVQNSIDEENQRIINDFKANAISLTVDYEYIKDGAPATEEVIIRNSDLDLGTTGLMDALIGPKQPLMNLADAINLKANKVYSSSSLNLAIGDPYQDTTDVINSNTIKSELLLRVNELNDILYNDTASSLGLFNKMALLNNKLDKDNTRIGNLEEALDILKAQYQIAKIDFQSTATALQTNISTAKDNYLIQKIILDIYVSKKFIAEQKRNAIQVAINRLTTEIATLNMNIVDAANVNSSITTLIANANAEIVNINARITGLNADITNLQTDLAVNITNIETGITTVNSLLNDTFMNINPNTLNYKELLFRLTLGNLASADKENLYYYPFRMLHLISILNDLRKNIDLQTPIVNTAQNNFDTITESYLDDVSNNVLTYTQQITAINAIKAEENDLLLKKSKLAQYQSDLNDYTGVYLDLVTYRSKIDLSKAELFASFTSGPLPISGTWPTSELLTFTMQLTEPLPYPISFQFVYKEDTQDVGTITIPAGSLQGTFSIYLRGFPNTYLDCGIPRWKISEYNGVIDPTDKIVFNVNKFNQYLVDWYKDTTLDTVESLDKQFIYSIDPTKYNLNARKPEYIMPVKTAVELETIFEGIKNLSIEYDAYRSNTSNLSLKESSKNSELNNLSYYTDYKNALNTNLASGNTTITLYQAEILAKTIIKTRYQSSILPITDVLGSDKSYDVLTTEITDLDLNISTITPIVNSKLNDFEDAKLALKTATETALQHFIDAIAEHNSLIQELKKDKDNIFAIHRLYEDRTTLLVNIHNNLRDIANSGVFLLPAEEIVLKAFEYQDALEHQIIETIDYLLLLPSSIIQYTNELEFVVGTNGLQYPTDLQPWIFIKSRGKISPRNYPGATSVGIALNENTLILNIRHNNCPDISEMLNVYGNAVDFNDQMRAIYNYNNASETKLKVLNSSIKLNKLQQVINSKLYIEPVLTTRLVSGVNISTVLTATEMDTLINLSNDAEGNELLWRLVYAKYFGSLIAEGGGRFYNPQDIILNYSGKVNGVNGKSPSSFFDLIGNSILNNQKDTLRLSTNTFLEKTTVLYNAVKVRLVLNDTVMKALFWEISSLYREIDIIKIIMGNMPNPAIIYSSKEQSMKQKYIGLLQDTLYLSRLNIKDNPVLDHIDPFENPNLDDAASSLDDSDLAPTTTIYAAKVAADIADIATYKTDQSYEALNISLYRKYLAFYRSLKMALDTSVEYYIKTKDNYSGIQSYFTTYIAELDSTYNNFYKRTNKLPNVMWDVFNITEGQRLKWNYTYCALRIMGMQKELNNSVQNNMVQYSPINSEINELKVKREIALTENRDTDAAVYQVHIDAVQLRKNQFVEILQNYVDEFNAVQRKFNATTITLETTLTLDKLITSLYIQNPDEYNLSYAFHPVPNYTIN